MNDLEENSSLKVIGTVTATVTHRNNLRNNRSVLSKNSLKASTIIIDFVKETNFRTVIFVVSVLH